MYCVLYFLFWDLLIPLVFVIYLAWHWILLLWPILLIFRNLPCSFILFHFIVPIYIPISHLMHLFFMHLFIIHLFILNYVYIITILILIFSFLVIYYFFPPSSFPLFLFPFFPFSFFPSPLFYFIFRFCIQNPRSIFHACLSWTLAWDDNRNGTYSLFERRSTIFFFCYLWRHRIWFNISYFCFLSCKVFFLKKSFFFLVFWWK